MGRRTGVLGGTFDPIHVGHLVAAVNARDALHLDRVVLMVANMPWQKAGTRVVSSPEDRLALVEASVGGVPGLEAGRLEIDRGGESYTSDTLEEMHDADPTEELFLIVGWDVADSLRTWERFEEVQSLATLVVVNRPGSVHNPRNLEAQDGEVEECAVPNLEISSTDLRARARGRAAARLFDTAGGCPLHPCPGSVLWPWMTSTEGRAFSCWGPCTPDGGAGGGGGPAPADPEVPSVPGDRLRPFAVAAG